MSDDIIKDLEWCCTPEAAEDPGYIPDIVEKGIKEILDLRLYVQQLEWELERARDDLAVARSMLV